MLHFHQLPAHLALPSGHVSPNLRPNKGNRRIPSLASKYTSHHKSKQYIKANNRKMALAMSSTAQHTSGAPCATMLRRTTFTGTPVAMPPMVGGRKSLPLRSFTPQALFARNKEQKVSSLRLTFTPACHLGVVHALMRPPSVVLRSCSMVCVL